MNAKEAVVCTQKFFVRHSKDSLRFSEHAINTLASGVEDRRSTFNLFEFGLRNEAPTRLQINHIQGYPDADPETERRLVQKKLLSVTEVIRSANNDHTAHFDIEAMNTVMRLFEKNRSAYCRVLFSFEADIPTGKAMKMTLYGRLNSKREADELCADLNLRSAPALARFISPNLCNVGIDFGSDRSSQLKVYRWWPLTPSDIKDKTLRSFLEFLHANFPLRDFATMLRLKKDGRPEPGLKWGVTFRHPTTVADIAQLKLLRDRYPDFLIRASNHVPNHHISYLAFDPKFMSIYCGKRIEAWLPWLRFHDE